jgi:hypothetical protein
MEQRELNRQVARATGESIRYVRKHGFIPLDVHSHTFDPDPEERPPLWVDWDELEASGRC